jgi:hypothetical protein
MATISGGFRGVPYGTYPPSSVSDQPSGTPGQPQRTLGGTVIDSLGLQASLAAPWSINGWTIGFDLWGFANVIGPMYGRFGNIFGGLCTNAQIPAANVGLGVAPVQSFPLNSSLISQIWDGDQSPCPPIIPTSGGGVLPAPARIMLSYPLPQPLIIQPGDQLSVGLWVTPSVICNVQLFLMNATWEITYDERQPAPAPWTSS